MAGGIRKKDSKLDLSKYGPGKRESSTPPKPPAAKAKPSKKK